MFNALILLSDYCNYSTLLGKKEVMIVSIILAYNVGE